MDLAKYIEEHFQKSKNLYDAKWNVVETLVAHGLKDLGFQIKEQNYKTPFGEIDILASYKGQLFMVEIKAVSEIDMLDRLNRSGQKRRLINIYNYMITKHPSNLVESLRAMLIVVERKSKEVIVYLDYLNIE